ncbi:hypothetical protein EBR96_09075, partial [bacterium]|nr:hypothetical protein [bacterium]
MNRVAVCVCWGIVGSGIVMPGILFAFNYSESVSPVYQQYYRWETGPDFYSENPYMNAMVRIRMDDPKTALRQLAGVPAPSIAAAPYADYVRFLAALRSGDTRLAKVYYDIFYKADKRSFLTRQSELDMVSADISKGNFASARSRINGLRDKDTNPAILGKLLKLQAELEVADGKAPDAVKAYVTMITYSFDLDPDFDLLNRLRKKFAADYRIDYMVNTPKLRAQYVDSLFRARRYKTLNEFVAVCTLRRDDFGSDLTQVLRQNALAYSRSNQKLKAAHEWFLVLESEKYDSEIRSEALTQRAAILLEPGSPHYEKGELIGDLETVANQYPKTKSAPLAMYTLATYLANTNEITGAEKVMRRFRKFYNDREPLTMQYTWDQQIRLISNSPDFNRGDLDQRFRSVMDNPEVSDVVLKWYERRFRKPTHYLNRKEPKRDPI